MTTITKKLFTLAEYHRLAEWGFFEQNNRVELIRGELIQMAAKGRNHSVCNSLVFGELYSILGKRANVRGQEPIILSNNSEPEPDVVIARKKADNYLSAHPTPDDILLVIEVADSTLKYDQTTKLEIYAEAGITDYWIFNLIDNQLELYNEPLKDSKSKFNYRFKRIALPTETVKIPEFSELTLDLAQVFPTQASSS